MPADKLPDPASGFELSVKDVEALAPAIASGELCLVDCREQDEWDFNRITGATLVPLSSFAEAAEQVVNANKPTIVYCHHGIRSMRAASWLRSRGLEQSWSMRGGIDAWSDQIDSAVPKY
ncbi:rhodanese-like domain-containing protein [Haloferula sp.]|uniref:rhodanese-like domain-containing protein n=1 Tax=Haloferula sp. TaxID=2497595 RepID=UPI0032A0688C